MARHVYDLELDIYRQYAWRTQYVEAVSEQYQLKEASTIPYQTKVVSIYPKLSEMELLLGVVATHTPWALFLPPKKFRLQRTTPFAFHRVAPSLGGSSKAEADLAKIDSIEASNPEDVQEKEKLKEFFGMMDKLNEMLGFIIGRVGQFLQA